MKKTATILLIIVISVALMAGCAALDNAAKLQEYDMSGDTIPSVNAIVGDRKVTGVASSSSTGSKSKTYTYESSTVTDDMVTYLTELMDNYGFISTMDAKFDQFPGTTEFAAESKDDGKVLVVHIEFDQGGYILTIIKMTGTLNLG